jgi:dinuclear metal center YbgI/SA1388 family protein
MPKLRTLTDYLHETLRLEQIPDYPTAINGLQLENNGRVTRIAAAVDATLPVIRKAIAEDADLLVVHHGMFWQGAQPITGGAYARLRLAIENNLAIYSAHIPLDVHPRYGNNALLAKALGLKNCDPFFPWKGILLGVRATVNLKRDSLAKTLGKALHGPVHVCPGGPATVRNIGIITGGAGSEIATVAREGIDTFITGEGPHWSYTAAEELGLNILYGGHYATETFGVRALVEHLGSRFKVPHSFIDHPTGL